MVDDSYRQLRRFIVQVDASPTLQDMVMECRSPEEIIAIAQKLGFPFDRDRLRKEAPWLSQPYWPWADRSKLTRVGFFSRG